MSTLPLFRSYNLMNLQTNALSQMSIGGARIFEPNTRQEHKGRDLWIYG